MKIESNSPVGKAGSVKKAKKTSSSDGVFAGILDGMTGVEGASAAEATQAVAPVAALGGVLGMQEVSDGEVSRKKAVRQGTQTLDALEDLRLSLMLGEVTESQVGRIYERMQQQKVNITDPALKAVMDEIEVRAAVELAKLEKARAQSDL